MIKLWLDDTRPAPEGWTHVHSVNEAAYELKDKAGRVSDLSLDHDLGDYAEDGGDGYSLLLWLAGENDGMANYWPMNPPTVHSMNPVGRVNMLGVIKRYGPYS